MQELRISTCLLSISVCWVPSLCTVCDSSLPTLHEGNTDLLLVPQLPALSLQWPAVCDGHMFSGYKSWGVGCLKRKSEKISSQPLKEQCDGLRNDLMMGWCLWLTWSVQGFVDNTMCMSGKQRTGCSVQQCPRGVAVHLFGLLVSTQDSFSQVSTFGHWQKVRDWGEVRI